MYAALKAVFINWLTIVLILSKQLLQENLVQEERIPKLGQIEKTNLHEWWAYVTQPRLFIYQSNVENWLNQRMSLTDVELILWTQDSTDVEN